MANTIEKHYEEVKQFPESTNYWLPIIGPKFDWLEKRRELVSRLDDDKKEDFSSDFTVRGNNFDQTVAGVDEFTRDTQQEWIEKIRKDLYIQECFNILNDMVNK